jgi:hypothetical protein
VDVEGNLAVSEWMKTAFPMIKSTKRIKLWLTKIPASLKTFLELSTSPASALTVTCAAKLHRLFSSVTTTLDLAWFFTSPKLKPSVNKLKKL